jgi:hypothetical protein
MLLKRAADKTVLPIADGGRIGARERKHRLKPNSLSRNLFEHSEFFCGVLMLHSSCSRQDH